MSDEGGHHDDEGKDETMKAKRIGLWCDGDV